MCTRYAHTRIHSAEKQHFCTAIRHRCDRRRLQRIPTEKSMPQHTLGARIDSLGRLAKAATLLRHSGRHHVA